MDFDTQRQRGWLCHHTFEPSRHDLDLWPPKSNQVISGG